MDRETTQGSGDRVECDPAIQTVEHVIVVRPVQNPQPMLDGAAVEGVGEEAAPRICRWVKALVVDLELEPVFQNSSVVAIFLFLGSEQLLSVILHLSHPSYSCGAAVLISSFVWALCVIGSAQADKSKRRITQL
jgi:hypothetical protein